MGPHPRPEIPQVPYRDRPVVFLDFDGVLNTWGSRFAQPPPIEPCDPSSSCWTKLHEGRERPSCEAIFRVYVERLNLIAAETGALFVVSSSWRWSTTQPELQMFLECRGFIGLVIGATPQLWYDDDNSAVIYPCRGDEIAAWRDHVGHEGPFVILDDEDDMGDLRGRLVHVNHGITAVDVQKAVAILRR